jgi:hypothetical protein
MFQQIVFQQSMLQQIVFQQNKIQQNYSSFESWQYFTFIERMAGVLKNIVINEHD